ncbi:MAG: putative flavoprotein involved in K+ transport [Gammaproteobacteria bacterium]|jgi:putative flavoprotein involved in K+ transport
MPDVVIIGAGQAGLAASVCLSRLGFDHVVLEKHEIGASWRRQRWDSFCLNTPNWTLNLPGRDYAGGDPDGFMDRDGFVDLLEGYAKDFAVPAQQGVEVQRAATTENGWQLETSSGSMRARAIIVATSTHQTPSFPAAAKRLDKSILSISAANYRAPDQLPDGKILIVGAAQSGMQIVEDLQEAGREIILSTGSVGRIPRRYRGRDVIYWYDQMGLMDRKASELDDPRQIFGGQPQYTGWRGGHTISLQKFHRDGVHLLGRVENIDGDTLRLATDLRQNIATADRSSAQFCRNVDAFIERQGLSCPADSGDDAAHDPLDDLDALPEPETLSLTQEGISTVIWATGFGCDFSWIDSEVFDSLGYPVTHRGETAAPGLYFLGLNFLHTRRSGIVYGVGADADYVAQRLHSYLGG